MTEVLSDLIEKAIVAGVIGLAVWYFTKRKMQKATIDKVEADSAGQYLDNHKKNLNLYQSMFDDLRKLLDERTVLYNKMKSCCQKCKAENEELKARISILEKTNNPSK